MTLRTSAVYQYRLQLLLLLLSQEKKITKQNQIFQQIRNSENPPDETCSVSNNSFPYNLHQRFDMFNFQHLHFRYYWPLLLQLLSATALHPLDVLSMFSSSSSSAPFLDLQRSPHPPSLSTFDREKRQ